MSAAEANVETVLRDRVAAAHNRRTEELHRGTETAARRLADRLATAATFRLVLEGPGGGEWYLVLRDGMMRVEASSDEAPVLTLFQAIEGWRRLLAAEAGFFGGDPGRTELSRERVARLKVLSGALEFRLSGVEGGRPVIALLQLGAGRDRLAPTTVLTLRAEDARLIRTGELTPQEAVMRGLVQMSGDLSLAIQVGFALFM